MTAPARLSRADFDSLLAARVGALITDAESAPEEQRERLLDDAALLEALAREFADAVDRAEHRGIPYDGAVVLYGSAGPITVPEADYRAQPIYWRVIASGGHGRLDRIDSGADLVRYLRDGGDVSWSDGSTLP